MGAATGNILPMGKKKVNPTKHNISGKKHNTCTMVHNEKVAKLCKIHIDCVEMEVALARILIDSIEGAILSASSLYKINTGIPFGESR